MAVHLAQTLPLSVALALCVSQSLLYVGGLYVLRTARARNLERNNATVIKQRMLSIVVTSAVSTIILYTVLSSYGVIASTADFAHGLGLHGEGLWAAIVLPVSLTALLFLGPLVQMYLTNELFFQDRHNWDLVTLRLTSWVGVRNFVVAPVSEEYIYRSNTLLALHSAGVSTTSMIFLSPLAFGILVQLTYTSVFGWYASYLFLRTGHLAAPVASHIFCNIMGLPEFGDIHLHRQRNLIRACYVVGLVLFSVAVVPLTRPNRYTSEPIYWSTYA
ncbi:CAAX prenyl protease [Sorochytrium milnesiophthora]